MGAQDKLNEYITHRGSGIFLCLAGVQEGGYLGEALFNRIQYYHINVPSQPYNC